MTIYLTSFKQYWEGDDDVHTWTYRMPAASVARYQPEWYHEMAVLPTFLPVDRGLYIRPRVVAVQLGSGATDAEVLQAYHDELLGLFRARWTEAPPDLDAYEDIALCCWCPYTKAAKAQLGKYGTFVCHTWPVETFLTELGYTVVRDEDRERMVQCA